MMDILTTKKNIYEFSQMGQFSKDWVIDYYANQLKVTTLENRLNDHKYHEDYVKKYYSFIEKEVKIKAAEMIFKQLMIDKETSKFK